MTKYKVGSTVTGNVTGIEKYGAFVSLDDYYSGLIHISEISDEGYLQMRSINPSTSDISISFNCLSTLYVKPDFSVIKFPSYDTVTTSIPASALSK